MDQPDQVTITETTTQKVIKLNLGSGLEPLKGFVNIDLDIRALPDMVCSIDQLPFRANSVTEIDAFHVIEHVYYWEAEAVLKEWFRVLIPGGKVVIECPNLDRVVKYLSKARDFTKSSQLGMWGFFGDPYHENPLYGHHWGYTPETLSAMLFRSGFTNIVSLRAQTHVPERDMRIEAEKPSVVQHPMAQAEAQPSSKPNVYWLLAGGEQWGSSRLHGYGIHKYLRAQGWNSHILVEPFAKDWATDVPVTLRDFRRLGLLRKNDIVIFQTFEGLNTSRLLEWMASQGVKTIYQDSDMPLKVAEAKLAQYTVCVSAFQTLQYKQNGARQSIYIPDPVESFRPPKLREANSTRLRCVWFGNWSAKREADIDYIRHLISQNYPDIELIVISDYPGADVQWDLKTVYACLHDSDFAVLPIRDADDAAKAKSSNRVVQAMALGLPVIASPIPAYEEVIHDGWNGFLCRTDDEWIEALNTIRQTEIRQQMAQNAYRFSRQFFTFEAVGTLWESLLKGIAADREPHPPDKSKLAMPLRRRRMRARAFAGLIERSNNVRYVARYTLMALSSSPLEGSLFRALYSGMFRLNRKVQKKLRKPNSRTS